MSSLTSSGHIGILPQQDRRNDFKFGGRRGTSPFRGQGVPFKTENPPDLTNYLLEAIQQKIAQNIFQTSRGPKFRGPNVTLFKTGKVTGFDPLFFKRGSFSKDIWSPMSPTGIDIFRGRGNRPPTVSSALFRTHVRSD